MTSSDPSNAEYRELCSVLDAAITREAQNHRRQDGCSGHFNADYMIDAAWPAVRPLAALVHAEKQISAQAAQGKVVRDSIRRLGRRGTLALAGAGYWYYNAGKSTKGEVQRNEKQVR